MILIHSSDWHGKTFKLPWADIYTFTGDMFEDYFIGGKPQKEKSRQIQESHLDVIGNLRDAYLTNKDAPVIICRGNHCFTDYEHRFGGEVYSIDTEPKSFKVKGITFGGVRGHPYIGPGHSDGIKDTFKLFKNMPSNIEVMLTHAPPYSILDSAFYCNIGMKGYLDYIKSYKSNNIKLGLFGHVHEGFGEEFIYNKLFSNASEGYRILKRKELNNNITWNLIKQSKIK